MEIKTLIKTKNKNENVFKGRTKSNIKVQKLETSSVFSPFQVNKNLMNYPEWSFSSSTTGYKGRF